MTQHFCGLCGQESCVTSDVGDAMAGHDRCYRAALLEPPRFCGECGRRMVVQVTPTGWTAMCSRHGGVTGAHR